MTSAGAGSAVARNQNHTVVESELSCPDPVRARNFVPEVYGADPDGYLLIGGPTPEPDAVFRCGCQASNGGEPQRGVKVIFEPTLVDSVGAQTVINPIRGRTNRRNGWFAADIVPPTGTFSSLLINAIRFAGNRQLDSSNCYCSVGVPQAPCQPDATTACLDRDRFSVEVSFTDPFDGRRREMTVADVVRDVATFSFFPLDNTELILQLLDACDDPNFGHFWVFAAATTNVEVEITVTDTQTGVVKDYTNPLGTPFQPIQDTQAFATCP